MTSGGKLMIPDRMSLSPTSHKHRHHHQLHRHLRTTTTLKAKTTIASTQPITSSTTAIPQVTTESVTEKPLHATLVASVPTHTHTIAAANSFTARSFYLYNRCTGAHVQVLGKRISALSSAQGKDENFGKSWELELKEKGNVRQPLSLLFSFLYRMACLSLF